MERGILTQVFGEEWSNLRLELEPLSGGLEATAIARATARYTDRRWRPRILTFIRKDLHGPARREVAVYERFAGPVGGRFAPRMLAAGHPGPERSVLYLEAIRPVRAWPWAVAHASRALLERLAELHSASRQASFDLPPWDYDRGLRASAESTLELRIAPMPPRARGRAGSPGLPDR